jgi:hypothetical protein
MIKSDKILIIPFAMMKTENQVIARVTFSDEQILLSPGNDSEYLGIISPSLNILKEKGMDSFVVCVKSPGRDGRIGAWLKENEKRVPISHLKLPGPGMLSLTLERDIIEEFPIINPLKEIKHKRAVQTFGEMEWEIFTSLTYTVVGCGRLGSLISSILVRAGVERIYFIDPDRVELHNIDSSFEIKGTDIGKSKVMALANVLSNTGSATEIIPVEKSIDSWDALDAIRNSDIVISCVDNAGARLCTSILCVLFLKPHLDIGAGVFSEDEKEFGIDVRLIIPPYGCISCNGGAGDEREIEGFFNNIIPISHSQRGGWSNVNLISAGIGMELLRRLISAETLENLWVRISWKKGEIPSFRWMERKPSKCPLCSEIMGRGERGLIKGFEKIKGG